ncbi:hypothetical protein Tco_1432979 [Tanacetum coccineum]
MLVTSGSVSVWFCFVLHRILSGSSFALVCLDLPGNMLSDLLLCLNLLICCCLRPSVAVCCSLLLSVCSALVHLCDSVLCTCLIYLSAESISVCCLLLFVYLCSDLSAAVV